MILRWEQGRGTIDRLLAERRLERIPANRELADLYLDQARAHIRTSRSAQGTDAVGEFQLAYDAARKALAALLVTQGLRPTHNGGHISVYEAVMAQFEPPLGAVFRPFGWMRPLRNDSEYPSVERPVAADADAEAGRAAAEAMIDAAERLLDQLPPYGR
ncbi:MAG: HEPN domain-containing protein [Micrococcales bacterium]|nr:HEPN domain-containing protein [Micrococcales bacterium]